MASVGRGPNVSVSEPQTVHVEKAEKKKNQPSTLGSVNTQDIEAYAKGRVHGEEDIQAVPVDCVMWKREGCLSEPM